MSAVVYKTNQRTVWAGLLAAINSPRFGNFRGQKDKIQLIMCYKILNSEVSLNCIFSICQLWLIREATSNSSVSIHINIFFQ